MIQTSHETGFGNEFERQIDWRWSAFRSIAPELAREARYTADAGVSHRGVHVGGVGIAFNSANAHPTKFWGANNTEKPGDPRYCSEMKIIEDAIRVTRDNRDKPAVKLYAVVISGPPQPDDISHLESPTLHCCSGCRGLYVRSFEDEDGPVDENTIILLVHPTMDLYEIYTPSEILTMHRQAKSKFIPPEQKMPFRVHGYLPEAMDAFELAHPEIIFNQAPILGQQEQTGPEY